MMSILLSNLCSTYCFTFSWKVLNWSFVLRCPVTVPVTDPTDVTSPVKLARDIFPGRLLLLLLLSVLILLFLVFFDVCSSITF